MFAMHRSQAKLLPTLPLLALMLVSCAGPAEKPAGADQSGMSLLGDRMRTTGDDAGAADAYQRALIRNPNDVRANRALAELLAAHGDLVGAEQHYATIAAARPDDISALRDHGRSLLLINKPAEARDEYERALQIDDTDVKSLNGIGVSLDYLGQHDAAQSAYRAALDEESDDKPTLANLGHSYVLAGDYNRAITLLEPHVADKTATPMMRQNLAEAYGYAGMYADAERMARMDLPAPQVAANLAYYRAQRGKLNIEPKFYADLGTYPTQAMAQGHADMLDQGYGITQMGAVLQIEPVVVAIGGTPSFGLRATGFASAGKLKNFCARLGKDGVTCKAHGA